MSTIKLYVIVILFFLFFAIDKQKSSHDLGALLSGEGDKNNLALSVENPLLASGTHTTNGLNILWW